MGLVTQKIKFYICKACSNETHSWTVQDEWAKDNKNLLDGCCSKAVHMTCRIKDLFHKQFSLSCM
jgi:hypothetical protein